MSGDVGYGKSETCEWYAAQNPTVFLRAMEEWTPSWMLEEMAFELGLKPRHNARTKELVRMVAEQIQVKLEQHPEFMIIIDEAGPRRPPPAADRDAARHRRHHEGAQM